MRFKPLTDSRLFSITRLMKNLNFILVLTACIGLTACGNASDQAPIEFRNHQTDSSASVAQVVNGSSTSSQTVVGEEDPELEAFLDEAEKAASPSGLAILQNARTMIRNQEIVVGSCWDFINAAYNRAGAVGKKRITVFKGVQAGPYADIALFQPGDWLYFINHSYGDVEHSSVFVGWIDYETKEALMISYAGGDRKEPARYKAYDLSSVYNIMRPQL
jgi:hypothetical protein